MAMLATQRCHSLGILYRLRVGQLFLDLTGARERVGKAITKAQLSGVAEAAGAVEVREAYF